MIQRILLLITILLLLSSSPKALAQANNGGKWKFLRRSIGISAMHVALLPSGRHVAFDRTDFGMSNISLPAGRCRDDKTDKVLRHDCTAHSIEFDPLNRAVRPLMVRTDTWCSSGALLPNGTLMQTGGFGDGERVVRYLLPCEGCDWSEDPNDESPEWIIEQMPIGRVMGDMVLLPTGQDVLIINGVSRGSAGWTMGREPVLNPILYKIVSEERNENPRFEVMNPTKIPRVYHSSAQLMVDGRVLVGGSNPNVFYEFSNVLFPTELSLEAFSPPYVGEHRPKIARVSTNDGKIRYGEKFSVQFNTKTEELKEIKVTMVAPTFTTHSFSMSQRVLVLSVKSVRKGVGFFKERYTMDVFSPASADVAPPGYYMVFVVHDDVPSRGKWVQLQP
ncbi:hypothetical protein LUZ60_011785 [Juncus effusus]|nr:hypothetical protein LUZ60_011785 [Juncus effusus]